MKRTYSSLWTGEDLAEDYGDSTAGTRQRTAELAQLPCTIMSCQQPCGCVNSSDACIASVAALCVISARDYSFKHPALGPQPSVS